MVHVLHADDHVVLGSHVVGDVVVDDEPEEAVEEGQVDLVPQPVHVALHHHVTLAVRRLPDILEVVDGLAPLVGEEGGRLLEWRR